MEDCEASTDVLQNQVDEVREKSQRELGELRRQLQEKGAEVEKSRQAAKNLQEEVWHYCLTDSWVYGFNSISHNVIQFEKQKELCFVSAIFSSLDSKKILKQISKTIYINVSNVLPDLIHFVFVW